MGNVRQGVNNNAATGRLEVSNVSTAQADHRAAVLLRLIIEVLGARERERCFLLLLLLLTSASPVPAQCHRPFTTGSGLCSPAARLDCFLPVLARFFREVGLAARQEGTKPTLSPLQRAPFSRQPALALIPLPTASSILLVLVLGTVRSFFVAAVVPRVFRPFPQSPLARPSLLSSRRVAWAADAISKTFCVPSILHSTHTHHHNGLALQRRQAVHPDTLQLREAAHSRPVATTALQHKVMGQQVSPACLVQPHAAPTTILFAPRHSRRHHHCPIVDARNGHLSETQVRAATQGRRQEAVPLGALSTVSTPQAPPSAN